MLEKLFNFVIEIAVANGYKMPLEIFGKIWLSIIKVEAKGVMGSKISMCKLTDFMLMEDFAFD